MQRPPHRRLVQDRLHFDARGLGNRRTIRKRRASGDTARKLARYGAQFLIEAVIDVDVAGGDCDDGLDVTDGDGDHGSLPRNNFRPSSIWPTIFITSSDAQARMSARSTNGEC